MLVIFFKDSAYSIPTTNIILICHIIIIMIMIIIMIKLTMTDLMAKMLLSQKPYLQLDSYHNEFISNAFMCFCIFTN